MGGTGVPPNQKKGPDMDRAALLEKVRGLAVETLEVDGNLVTETAGFADDLEADSLDLVELVMAIEESFEIVIPEEDLEGVKTVGDALDLIQGKLAVA